MNEQCHYGLSTTQQFLSVQSKKELFREISLPFVTLTIANIVASHFIHNSQLVRHKRILWLTLVVVNKYYYVAASS